MKNDTAILKNRISHLRNFLKKNSINENTAKQLEWILLNKFSFITNLTVKKKIDEFSRITVNSRVNQGENIRITDISKLKYPPNGALNNGRANLIGEKILYGTFNIITALKEARVEKNQLITISTWKLKTNKALIATPIFKNYPLKTNVLNVDLFGFYTEYNNKLKEYDEEAKERINIFVQFLTDCFTKEVEGSNHFDYFLSSFYANRLFNYLQNGEIEAILYPSVKEDLVTANIAMKHTVFDQNYELFQVKEKIVVKVPTGENSYCELKPVANSKIFINEEIIW